MIVTCSVCGKPLNRPPCRVKREVPSFCDRRCHHIWQKGRTYIGEEGRAAIRESNATRSSAYMAKVDPRHMGEANGRWVGESVTINGAYQRANALFPVKPCEVCGLSPAAVRIERHHKDRNPRNNESNNVQYLCTKHHKAAHRLMKQQKERVAACQSED